MQKIEQPIVVTQTQLDKLETKYKSERGSKRFLLAGSLISIATSFYLIFNPIEKTKIKEEIKYEKLDKEVFKEVEFDTWKELDCMALNIYHEARGEMISGMYHTAHVVMNRVKNREYPNTVCEVVYQEKQFSWTFDGRSDETKERVAWAKSLQIAYDVLVLEDEDRTNGATAYHVKDPNVKFSKKHHERLTFLGQNGKHVFYRDIARR